MAYWNDLKVGDVITYHGSRHLLSKLISFGAELAGQWDFDKFPWFPAPSHALIKIGDTEVAEADWGRPLFWFIPWKRVDAGIRVFDYRQLGMRNGYHVAWRAPEGEMTENDKNRIQYHIKELAAKRVDYDFIGLISIAKATLAKIKRKEVSYDRADDQTRYFCSELVAELLFKYGKVPNYSDLLPYQFSPALLVTLGKLDLVGQLSLPNQ